jgi:4-hydroxythreonine-4-phosphate dehydrogenase
MSDSKDNAPKPSAPSSNDVAGNNDPNRRRRGGRNRNPRKKAETPEGKKEAGVTSNAQPKVVASDTRDVGGTEEGARRNNRNRNRNKGKSATPARNVKATPVSESVQSELAAQAELYANDFEMSRSRHSEVLPDMLKKPVIGITCGDLNGVGMEVIIKTLEDKAILDLCTPVVFASSKLASYHRNAINRRDFNFHVCDSVDDIHRGKNNLINVWEDNVELSLGTPTDVSGSYALKSIDAAIAAAQLGNVDAIVTAPINKHNIADTIEGFTGHTGYLASALGNEVLMVLTSEQLKVATVTGHIPVSSVAESLTEEAIINALSILKASLKRDFGKIKPTIAVLGLNPHAGEMGTIGKEEQEIIAPAIAKSQSKDSIIKGPFPADGFFGQGFDMKFDAVLGMYHDQVLIPFKAIAMGTGTNFTAGLEIVRTSPDHGTAMNVAGKGVADENSFRGSLFSAIDVFHQRTMHDEMTKNPLKKQKDKR